MKGHKQTICIDEKALEDTLIACRQQQEENVNIYEPSLFHLVIRYLYLDFRNFAILSILLFAIMMVGISFLHFSTEGSLITYFFTIGLSSIYEIYKNKYYHTDETITPVFLGNGRAMLIKSAGIAIIELLLSIITLCYLYINNPSNLFIITFGCMLPLYILQTLSMYMYPFVRGYMTTFLLYILLYIGYLGFYIAYLQKQVAPSWCMLISLVIIVLYMFHLLNLVFNLQKQGGKYHGITYRTH